MADVKTRNNIVVPLGTKHRVLIDEYNHTLQVERPSSKKGWKTLGYYNNFAGIVYRLATVEELEDGVYTAAEYADSVVKKAEQLCEELKQKGLK